MDAHGHGCKACLLLDRDLDLDRVSRFSSLGRVEQGGRLTLLLSMWWQVSGKEREAMREACLGVAPPNLRDAPREVERHVVSDAVHLRGQIGLQVRDWLGV